jgi:hypothetical protein
MVIKITDVLDWGSKRASSFERTSVTGPILLRDELVESFPNEWDARSFLTWACHRFTMEASAFTVNGGQLYLNEGPAGLVQRLRDYALGYLDGFAAMSA